MSQHVFPATTSTGRAVEVLIGYDRPLHGFFLVVEAAELDTVALADWIGSGDNEDPEGDCFIYSNLMDIGLIDLGGHTLDLGYFKAKLALLGIGLPTTIESELQDDLRARAGNRFCEYDAHGVLVPDAEG